MATIGVTAYNVVAPKRDQRYLLPPSLSDWLPEDHLAWFVLDCVDELDLRAFYGDYRKDGWGGAAHHHPKTMVALLVYAYSLGVRSSRQIERACHVDVGFRVICAGLFPDHTTIARFRQRHEAALKSIFTASLRLCATAGMTSVGIVALDGTMMAANASMSANRTKATIDDAVEEMFADVKATDAAEDAELGDARGDEPPATLRGRADRSWRFKAAKELLDKELEEERGPWGPSRRARGRRGTTRQEAAGPQPKAPQDKAGAKEKKANTTDPESKVMSTAKGFIQGYNAQAVANEDQVIVAAKVTDEQNDLGQLHPMIEATKASLAQAGIDDRPDKLLADAGYCSEEKLAAIDDDDPDTYVATRNMKKNQTPRTGWRGPLRKDATLVEKMDRKVSNKAGRALYRKRQYLIEPVFGQIKDGRHIRGFMRRGKSAAASEWKLVCGTHNLLKLYRRALGNAGAAPYSGMAGGIAC